MSRSESGSSPFRQPKAVWAVALACVVSFMGIGLVDPILPALADQLHASPSQVSLLFTSYLIVTAVMMLFVGAISSRIGPKRTLLGGLVLIVAFAALAGTSDSIAGIVGFRAGWGVGNALFIATSLAVIVASASGGFAGAIILYETALGLGIAVGPLLGGILGDISWRLPFYGVAILMAVAMIATFFFVPDLPRPQHKASLLDPLKALRHRGLLTMGITALLYNWGFFTMLGYAPYPMELGAHALGLVFTGWGLLVAIFSVFVAPRLQARFGTAPVLYANLLGLTIVMAVIAFGVGAPPVVASCVVISGAFIGINNTLTTQAVMVVSPVDRSVASSAYGFVRFIGGGLAPFVAGKLADATGSLATPFFLGALTFALAIGVLATGHRLLAEAEKQLSEGEEVQPSVQRLRPISAAAEVRSPVVVAVGPRPGATEILDIAADFAHARNSPLNVIMVHETAIVDDGAVEPESLTEARRQLIEQLDRLSGSAHAAAGYLLNSVGDHADAGRVLAEYAERVEAAAVVIGRSPRGAGVQFADGSLTDALICASGCSVLLVDAEHRLQQLDVPTATYLRDHATA